MKWDGNNMVDWNNKIILVDCNEENIHWEISWIAESGIGDFEGLGVCHFSL